MKSLGLPNISFAFSSSGLMFSDVNAGFASLNAGADPGGDTIERTGVAPLTHGGEDTHAGGVESVPLVLSSSFPGPLAAARASLTHEAGGWEDDNGEGAAACSTTEALAARFIVPQWKINASE